ncbi:MAG TPA: tryptophan--tRNA ligase [Nitriliruptorales bacterium]|nr:tryptophan--tRNA ligase [Nitriliruptorales bacterium]
MTRVLSGIQPSGDFHVGNYLGAVRRWVEQQDRVDAYHPIVDLHAMTLPHDPATLRTATLRLAATLFGAGLDPDRATVFVQSHVHEHAELAWLLNCVASMGELNRMVQWKEKSEGREFVSVALFDYPVLQAADILLYQAEQVPVGEDQRQHIELTRDVAQRFNHRFGEVFTLPEATVPPAGARVMDLQLVDRKMSKSLDSPRGTINLSDRPDEISKKVMAAVTDSGNVIRAAPDKPGISNLLDLMSALTGEEIAALEARYEGKGYGEFKRDVAQALVELLRPVQARIDELNRDLGEVQRLLAIGADKARAVASETLRHAKDAVGLVPPEGPSWSDAGRVAAPREGHARAPGW